MDCSSIAGLFRRRTDLATRGNPKREAIARRALLARGGTTRRTWKSLWINLLVLFVFSNLQVSSGDQAPAATRPVPGTLYAVGDILYRDTFEGAELVGRLMERLLGANPINGRGILLGDVCNDEGRPECYDRLEQTAWGPLRPLLYPVPGNHDYQDARRNGGIPYYYNYMLNAGERERGWHAFDWGGWRILAINTEVMARDAQNRRSPLSIEQMEWMERELRQYAKDRCVLTYYHRPMYSSGRFASPAWVGPIFRKSFKHGVDFYVAAHEHMFNALPPLTPFLDSSRVAKVDLTYGIPGIISGTGGAVLFPHPTVDPQIRPDERRLKWEAYGEQLLTDTWGIVGIDLLPGAYWWKFIPVSPVQGVGYPSGSGRCHPPPPDYTESPIN